MTAHMVGAYWKARKESVHACTDRLMHFLATLSNCDPNLSTWYERGKSRRGALQREVDFRNKDHLRELLERGRNRRDTDRQVIENLGFRVSIWNGAESERAAGISIKCGLHTPNPHLRNCVVLDLPKDLGELSRSERMTQVLAVVARSWQPDWAGVFSLDAMSKRNFNAEVPFVDWMLYVSHKLLATPIVSEPSCFRPVDGIGSLIVVQQDPVEADNPVHLQRVRGVETALGINR